MRIRYFSDIHLEFLKQNKMENFIRKIPVTNSHQEVCILAGDIGNPYSSNYNYFMQFIHEKFKKSFVIAGNHEYYNNGKMSDTKSHMKQYFSQYNNISFLDDNYENYDDYCFIGTTLWSKITDPSHEINDVYNISNFDYIKYNRLNRMSVDFLEDAVKNNTNNIIITHHGPSMSLIDAKYLTPKMRPYNQWFYSDMDNFIEENKDKIKCWFYGHTHTPSEKTICGIPILCNPIGYPNENPKIDLGKTYEVTNHKI